MKPRTRKMKEKQLEETIAKAKEIEKQIPPDTPGFAMGGGVMMPRRRNISGLTNLFSKYNTSGPLAGAGVPRGTMPVEMRRGGRADSPREEAYRTDAPTRRDGIIARPNRVVIPSPDPTPPPILTPPMLREEVLRTEPTTLEELQAILPPVVQDPVPLPPVVQDPVPPPPVVQDNQPVVLTEPTTLEELQAILPPPSTAADLNISDGRADELGAFDQPTPEPVISAPTAAPVVSAPFTPSTGIVAGGPAPGEVEVTREDDGIILEGRIPQPDPLPPPPPPPVMDLPPPPPPVIETPPPVVEPDPMPLPPVEPAPAPVPPVEPAPLPPIPPVDVVEPPTEIPLPPIEETPLPPPVYTPPTPTEVVVPEEPVFTPPPIAETPQLPDPVMLSGETVDFDIADEITPQTGGYATTQGMNIVATGDPFADAVAGEYQMPIYRPRPVAGAMPFLSLNFARPSTPSDPPPPPKSENYSTGSYGRLEFAEALAAYERMYGPVEDYQAPDTDAVMTDDTTATGASTVSSGTRFYPEPPPVRGSGGIGPQNLYRRQLEAWEAQYGPVEDYYAAQNAAQQNDINMYLSRQGEDAIAAQYGMTIEQLRDVNARRREQGLPPLGDINLPDIGDFAP
jgi:hypothetical protein